METSLFLPDLIAKNFTCSFCNKYLFVPPITANEDGSAFRCGRCCFITTNLKTPVHGFEKLVSYMSFPCTYNGCAERLPWAKVVDHEAACEFRIITCPWYSCRDSFPCNAVLTHFTKQHKKYICRNQCIVFNKNIKQANRCLMRLLTFKDQVFFMLTYRDAAHFWLSVYSLMPISEDLHYDVVVSSLDGRRSMKICKEPIVLFDDQEHCVNCLDRICKSKFHKFSQLYEENSDRIYEKMTTAVKIDYIARFLGSKNINYSVEIAGENEEKFLNGDVSSSSLVAKHDRIVLFSLECPICKLFMSAPIYNCQRGHAICKDCKVKLMKCPLCEESLTNSRCFPLEEIADRIKLECKNAERGCKFIGNVDENFEHEAVCNAKEH